MPLGARPQRLCKLAAHSFTPLSASSACLLCPWVLRLNPTCEAFYAFAVIECLIENHNTECAPVYQLGAEYKF